ncbi:4-(cytidine 5'-diphospho)-2-C-methyl-D-erythritol kinase [Arcobacter sp. CECT 8983]|uniref:4-(cytidine 5'-diphospho)-2-C-methyl-D-erythritol kinase n=1 Tax=Arcobacter sp. CECT 8983 TaxID=2044508 RepID=UPI00100B968A|nr:4-(cytidine 5'-diphospho)-2-C-methyl-D-erythritol kinase [Arcobacter sp. CECT 8983]RXJ88582.1 4-(cytidine 5'-diphospho)-2-C-methyl-D-erythritol kinase [Arcobacter sp. CECT 8983]
MIVTKKSYAKVNIFLKIVGKRDNYHELASRFVRVHSLYDLVSFEDEACKEFTLEGNFGCELKKNTIYKAYLLLKEVSPKVEEYFKNKKVKVEKNIPEFAGLGGGSSNAATFILMVNEECNLGLTKDELCNLAVKIGADVPFFVYEYDSANVSGIGEKIEKFDEEVLNIEIITPNIKCDTGLIFKAFREKFYKESTDEEILKLFSQKSVEIIKEYSISAANDLYKPAKSIKKELEKFEKKDWFFSGSGSSFFKVNNVKK